MPEDSADPWIMSGTYEDEKVWQICSTTGSRCSSPEARKPAWREHSDPRMAIQDGTKSHSSLKSWTGAGWAIWSTTESSAAELTFGELYCIEVLIPDKGTKMKGGDRDWKPGGLHMKNGNKKTRKERVTEEINRAKCHAKMLGKIRELQSSH